MNEIHRNDKAATQKREVVGLCPSGVGGGGGGLCSLIFSYIRRLGPFSWVKNVQFRDFFWIFRKINIFWGYENLWLFFGVITKLGYI